MQIFLSYILSYLSSCNFINVLIQCDVSWVTKANRISI